MLATDIVGKVWIGKGSLHMYAQLVQVFRVLSRVGEGKGLA